MTDKEINPSPIAKQGADLNLHWFKTPWANRRCPINHHDCRLQIGR